jgi:hypothetical protein
VPHRLHGVQIEIDNVIAVAFAAAELVNRLNSTAQNRRG